MDYKEIGVKIVKPKHCNALGHYYVLLSVSFQTAPCSTAPKECLDKEDNFLLREQFFWGQNRYQEVFLLIISRWFVMTQRIKRITNGKDEIGERLAGQPQELRQLV